jgi:hypothetical protein
LFLVLVFVVKANDSPAKPLRKQFAIRNLPASAKRSQFQQIFGSAFVSNLRHKDIMLTPADYTVGNSILVSNVTKPRICKRWNWTRLKKLSPDQVKKNKEIAQQNKEIQNLRGFLPMSTTTTAEKELSSMSDSSTDSHVEALRYAMQLATEEELLAEFSRVLRESQHLIEEQMITLLESCCNAEEMGSIANMLVVKQQR